jgi:hypothetical protein
VAVKVLHDDEQQLCVAMVNLAAATLEVQR